MKDISVRYCIVVNIVVMLAEEFLCNHTPLHHRIFSVHSLLGNPLTKHCKQNINYKLLYTYEYDYGVNNDQKCKITRMDRRTDGRTDGPVLKTPLKNISFSVLTTMARLLLLEARKMLLKIG